ncbi:hypothetical protein [Cryptosporangium aurantiacum]|uniref:Methyltransferase domain-containing protein n=1 Tax=Cryptosporangium aurantiacum TaxID=134849 RepID=A0A1M7TW16_9ACTN|nr:hypothetical protein [Cryptosporangium aurantiacum]SHN74901.1 hypothetical protein SAMN05443668_107171 [Cryptosporangium aurantiacum]
MSDRTTWGIGDYPAMARRLLAGLCGGHVTGVDLEPALLGDATLLPGSGAPSRWGDVDAVLDLLAASGLSVVSARRREVRLRGADAEAATTLLAETAGHLIAERPRLEAEQRWKPLLDDLRAFVVERSVRDEAGLSLPLEYLLVTAERG